MVRKIGKHMLTLGLRACYGLPVVPSPFPSGTLRSREPYRVFFPGRRGRLASGDWMRVGGCFVRASSFPILARAEALGKLMNSERAARAIASVSPRSGARSQRNRGWLFFGRTENLGLTPPGYTRSPPSRLFAAGPVRGSRADQARQNRPGASRRLHDQGQASSASGSRTEPVVPTPHSRRLPPGE